MKKSVAELEKLYNEKTGVNFVIPSNRGHEKVLVDAGSNFFLFFL